MTAGRGNERLGGAAARLMDRFAHFGEDAEVEAVVALASIRLPSGELRVELVAEPGDHDVVLQALRPALAALELGIGDRWTYRPPDTEQESRDE